MFATTVGSSECASLRTYSSFGAQKEVDERFGQFTAQLKQHTAYSWRRTWTGSTRAARQAGRSEVAVATAAMSSRTAA